MGEQGGYPAGQGEPRPAGEQRVVITDIRVPFGSVFVLVFKIFVATLFFYLIVMVLMLLFAGTFGLLGSLGVSP